MELIEKMAQAAYEANSVSRWCDASDFVKQRYRDLAQAALTALIEYAGGDGVTQADYDAAARLNGYANWSVFKAAPQHDAEWMELCAHDFARHRATAFAAAFADGFTAALQGAEAAIWRIEDDAFLHENVSKALQEVISELQAMEQNWTGRATIEHRQAAIKERDAQIVAKLRKTAHSLWERDYSDESFTVEYLADAIEQGEV